MPYITTRQLANLRKVRDILKMEHCGFHLPEDDNMLMSRKYIDKDGNVLTGWVETGKAFTEDVKEGTRLWRESWIMPTLNEIVGE